MKKIYMKNEMSLIMKFFYKLGLFKISWALRRLHCPVTKKMLVLEIGSGGNPYFRSNILLDSSFESQERHWAPLIKDRPIVLGIGESLPFKDNAFDFVIASHVLEHSAYPEKFINELQRVGNAGYIETPDAFMERINPYYDHRSEVYVKDESLIIKKKGAWYTDENLLSLYNRKAKDYISKVSIPSNPFIFHARLYWNKKIKFKILNPNINSNWQAPQIKNKNLSQDSFIVNCKRLVLFLARFFLSQKKRHRNLDVKKILICPSCKSSNLLFGYCKIKCTSCNAAFNYEKDIPNMTIK